MGEPAGALDRSPKYVDPVLMTTCSNFNAAPPLRRPRTASTISCRIRVLTCDARELQSPGQSVQTQMYRSQAYDFAAYFRWSGNEPAAVYPLSAMSTPNDNLNRRFIIRVNSRRISKALLFRVGQR